MADPIQRGGVWWTQREDGSWLRWDESSTSWQPSPDPPPPEAAGLPPVPPMPTGTGGYPAMWGGPAAIPNDLVWALLVTIFCFLPTGIVAIVFASQVDSKLAAGDRAGALDSSNKARMWVIISAVAGIALGIVLAIVFAATTTVTHVDVNFP